MIDLMYSKKGRKIQKKKKEKCNNDKRIMVLLQNTVGQ